MVTSSSYIPVSIVFGYYVMALTSCNMPLVHGLLLVTGGITRPFVSCSHALFTHFTHTHLLADGALLVYDV